MNDLPKTMKALVAYGNGDYRLETAYPVPECGEDDIIIKTEGCGICAGDLKCQHGAAMFWGDEKEAQEQNIPQPASLKVGMLAQVQICTRVMVATARITITTTCCGLHWLTLRTGAVHSGGGC